MGNTTTPADGSTNVLRDSFLSATFSKDLLATSVDVTNFTDGVVVPGTVALEGSAKATKFTPSNRLGPLPEYQGNLSTGIVDTGGTHLASAYNWSFTTQDGSWRTHELIETDNAGNANRPQFAFDSSGKGMAAERWNGY